MENKNYVNGWDENRKLVLHELSALKCDTERIFEKLDGISMEITTLKIELRLKSGIWGVIGGSIPTLIMIIIYLVFKR